MSSAVAQASRELDALVHRVRVLVSPEAAAGCNSKAAAAAALRERGITAGFLQFFNNHRFARLPIQALRMLLKALPAGLVRQSGTLSPSSPPQPRSCWHAHACAYIRWQG